MNSLNDPNSDAYRRLSSELRSNFDKEFSNVQYYNGMNVIGFRKGSVICDTEIIVVENFEDNITQVLDNVKTTGQLGNFSIESLTFTAIADLSDIQLGVQYSGLAGDELEITCTVTGPSLPSFEWRNGSVILSRSTRVKIENNNQVSKLSVRKTAKADAGAYHCIAR